MAKTDQLIALLERYKRLGIDSQIDYEKFYLYSIITHSTAIEGSTVTEIENQLLFDEGISAKGKTIAEQMIKTLSMDIESFLKSTQESGEKILALLKEHSEYSARKLAEEIGITPKAVEKQLANLKASGLIRREGPDKGGKWIIS